MKDKLLNLLRKVKKNIVEYVISNRLFLSYFILALSGTLFVRHFTIGGLWSFNPIITDLGLILIIGSFGYLVKPKKQFNYYFIWLIIFTTINIVSSIYFTFYSTFASLTDLATASQVGSVAGSIFEKLKFTDVMYIFVPIIFYLVHNSLLKTTYYHFLEKIEKSKTMLVITLITGTIFFGYSFATAKGKDFSRLAKQWNRNYVVKRFGIITYQFNDIIQSLTPKLSTLFGYDEALEKFNLYFDKKEKTPKNKYTGILKGKNIVFVHMESIQTFLMDLEFNGREATPNLNKIAKEGMFFENFFPQVSLGTSSDTEFSLTTGLLPAAGGAVFVSYYNRNYFSLPKILKNEGYYTFSMHGNDVTMWNRYKAHPSLGYEGLYYKDTFEVNKEDVVNLGINDYVFFEQGVKKMEQIEEEHQNYMGTVITLSNHSPFSKACKLSTLDLSMEYQKTDEETGITTTEKSDYLTNSTVGEYIRSANYADGAMGDFIKYINESDKFNDTVFVFYGDHDAKLTRNEINYLYNVNPETGEVYTKNDKNYKKYDYYDHELNKKTPLIFWTKNKALRKKLKGTISYTTGMYNVSPTILNMYGLYNKYTVSEDIFSIKNDNIVVYPNGNIKTDKLYYNNSLNEYKVLKGKDDIKEEDIERLSAIADERLDISKAIIIHDLLKDKKIGEE